MDVPLIPTSARAHETRGGTHLRGEVVTLDAGTVSVVVDLRGEGLPTIVHWGSRLVGDVSDPGVWDAPVPNSSFDVAIVRSLVPEAASGHKEHPGLLGHRDGRGWSPRFVRTGVQRSTGEGAATGGGEVQSLVVDAADDTGSLSLATEVHLHSSGMLRMRHRLHNDGPDDYTLEQLALQLPLPLDAAEMLDLTGRWCRERHPQRRRIDQGSWVRESRHGRTGHDASLIVAAGTPGFSFRSGEVWAIHLGWSGNHVSWVERATDGSGSIGAAELLLPGEVVLPVGRSYTTPWLYAAHSEQGLDGVSDTFHAFIRARDVHPRSPRPVVLNTWEAVYFRHDLDELTQLADTAADLGVERFVLDDGWFQRRRDDTAGLGDWVADDHVWPDGLEPLIAHVRELGMQFGLWVEPEMVNPDSDLFRQHPDWVLRPDEDRLPLPWRGQQVLDLVNPDAYAFLYGQLDTLLTELDIAYLKWDHNRDLLEAGHDGKPAVHDQTLAVYRLLDELRAAHPDVEIESCSSGGARIDLGILERTDRVWASDTNDALERQMIQLWTQLLVPPELVGAHVGPPTAHTTGRTHALEFRVATALFGHFGFEWDIRQADDSERERLRAAVTFYKFHRELLHRGRVVRGDHPDPAINVHGVVAEDGSEALFVIATLATSVFEVPGRVRLPGLKPDVPYEVRAVDPLGGEQPSVRTAAPWMEKGGVVMPAGALGAVGLPMPILRPEQAVLVHCTAVDEQPAEGAKG